MPLVHMLLRLNTTSNSKNEGLVSRKKLRSMSSQALGREISLGILFKSFILSTLDIDSNCERFRRKNALLATTLGFHSESFQLIQRGLPLACKILLKHGDRVRKIFESKEVGVYNANQRSIWGVEI